MSQGASQAANFFCYWFGVRAESDQNPERFKAEIKTNFEKVWINAAAKRFLSYQLTGEEIPNGSEADVIGEAQIHSVIDLYECCVQVSRICAAESRDASFPLYQLFIPFMERIGDSRVGKISFLMGNLAAAINFDAPDVSTELSFLQGKAPDKAGAPTPTEVFRFGSVGIVLEDRRPGIAKAVHEVEFVPERAEIARESLLQTALLFPRFNIGELCASIFSLTESPNPHGEHALRRRMFMASNSHDPSILSFLPAEISDFYGAFLTAELGLASDIIDYHKFDPAIGPNASVAEAPRLWWEFTVRARAKDYGGVARVLREARDGGTPSTRTVMWCEIEALLSAGLIFAAVDVVADLYRREPRLMNWLPYERLAARLDDMTVGRYVGSTNMALVTWLLAENFDRDFRSSLSYAVDQYLDDKRVTRPSELQADHASGLEELAFFLWTICTEDTLSLSLRA